MNVKGLNRERGATAIIVAVVLLVLVGFGALAVDVGGLLSDKKQLQNGADAGALAIAQACASDPGHPECVLGLSPAAGDFAEWNKLDGNANGEVVELVPTGSDRHVTVETTSTRQLWLANVLGIGSAPVTARATATWSGAPSSLSTIPFAVSYCQFSWQNGGATSGTPTPGSAVKIWLKSKAKDYPGDPVDFPCMNGGAHNEAAGGFGWLAPDESCRVTTTAGTWVHSDPGNNLPCTSAQIIQLLGSTPGKVILMPMFTRANGSGSNGQFLISGYAALQITSYCFQPEPRMSGASCNGNTQHISATFVGWATLDDVPAGGGGSGVDYGVVSVKLAG